MNGELQKVYIGVGGTGNDLLNQLIAAGEAKRGLFAVDTDAQALMKSLSPKRIQIGEKETRGLGTIGDVEMGRRAAEEAREKLLPLFERGENIYILTGLQGGTSLGLVPVLCECAKAADAHTVLYVVIDGETPTEKEINIITTWRTLADELHVFPREIQEE